MFEVLSERLGPSDLRGKRRALEALEACRADSEVQLPSVERYERWRSTGPMGTRLPLAVSFAACLALRLWPEASMEEGEQVRCVQAALQITRRSLRGTTD